MKAELRLCPSLILFIFSLSIQGKVSVAVIELLLQTPCLTKRKHALGVCQPLWDRGLCPFDLRKTRAEGN